VAKLERRKNRLDRAVDFNPYRQITAQALRRLTYEQLNLCESLLLAREDGREYTPTVEEAAAVAAFTAALNEECARFGITVAQHAKGHGLAKRAVAQLRCAYIEDNPGTLL
jgi:sugar phosphate isomerase/epimerase